MRLLICDYQVVFAESLAHLLTARGKQVVAVTHDVDGTIAALGQHSIDVCLLDVAFGGERALDRLPDLHRAAPRTRLVLLCARVDSALVAAAHAAGVSGIADKRQSVAELIGLLDRVHAGMTGPLARHPVSPVSPATRRRPANDAQRLAAFLTPRERQVLSALVCGDNTSKVARSLGIAANTARCHIQSLLTKMGAHSRLEVATTAVRCGMVNPDTGEWLIPVGQ